MEHKENTSGVTAAFQTVGLATVVAIIVGVGVWLIQEFVIGADRSAAVGTGAKVAGVLLLAGALVGVLRALRASRHI